MHFLSCLWSLRLTVWILWLRFWHSVHQGFVVWFVCMHVCVLAVVLVRWELGPHPLILSDHSWLGSGDRIWCWGLNYGQPCPLPTILSFKSVDLILPFFLLAFGLQLAVLTSASVPRDHSWGSLGIICGAGDLTRVGLMQEWNLPFVLSL